MREFESLKEWKSEKKIEEREVYVDKKKKKKESWRIWRDEEDEENEEEK